MTAMTAMLVAHALRSYADMLSRPRTEEIGLFQIDVARLGEVEPQIVCVTGSIAMARSAFEIAQTEYPDRAVTLRHGRRVLERRSGSAESDNLNVTPL